MTSATHKVPIHYGIGLLFFVFYSITPGFGQTVAEGKQIFNGNCIACHTIGDGRLVGPDLQDVTERRSQDWLLKYILDPEKMMDEGDTIANQLFEEYKTIMPPQELSIKKIESVLLYIKQQSGNLEKKRSQAPAQSEASSKEETTASAEHKKVTSPDKKDKTTSSDENFKKSVAQKKNTSQQSVVKGNIQETNQVNTNSLLDLILKIYLSIVGLVFIMVFWVLYKTIRVLSGLKH